MLNQLVIVGRMVREPELYETDTGRKVTSIVLAVPRSYKNSNGEYDTDFVKCILWQGIAENTTQYVKKGDLLGVKGRIQSKERELMDGTKWTYLEVVAEKVTFLSSKPKEKREK